MRFGFTFLALGATFLPQTFANFDVYAAIEELPSAGIYRYGYQVFATDPSCNEVFDRWFWNWQSDVSGTKTGMRCSASPSSACFPDIDGRVERDPANINQLEMNFHGTNPIYHWTLYKDRGYTMVGLDGNTYGNCILFPKHTYDCEESGTYRYAERKFRCLTQFTADQLNNAPYL
ncbi:hypothetical protein BKA67DRAFT_615057 [Truncatella angustata]|uniref:Uncharacterized protein n=1 Tax=Truncatella angustata TaxID=152316 RepID=A0A9P8REI8_9PEZI|nr:uncharacterized protein BKA67DRAFT_615057 [Truncatella angustata]KAH6638669.1 hypothetical protein BKA67DRAFT_615057 [Truncatella angustata]